MKRLFLFLCVCYAASGFSQSSAFNFSDTVLSVGQKKILNVRYRLGRAELDTLNKPVIDSLYRFLVHHPTISLEIGGHFTENPNRSTIFSEARPRHVVDTLIKMGVDSKRLTWKGYGEFQPLVSEALILKAKTREEANALRAKNRRTEIKIMSTTFKP